MFEPVRRQRSDNGTLIRTIATALPPIPERFFGEKLRPVGATVAELRAQNVELREQLSVSRNAACRPTKKCGVRASCSGAI